MSKKPPSFTVTLRASPLILVLILVDSPFNIITQLSVVGLPLGNQLLLVFQSLFPASYILVLLISAICPVEGHAAEPPVFAFIVNGLVLNCKSVGLIYTVCKRVPGVYAISAVGLVYTSTPGMSHSKSVTVFSPNNFILSTAIPSGSQPELPSAYDTCLMRIFKSG